MWLYSTREEGIGSREITYREASCRCCFFRGRNHSLKEEIGHPNQRKGEQKPTGTLAPLSSTGSSGLMDIPANGDPVSFLFVSPRKTAGGSSVTAEQVQAQATHTAVSAVVPIIAGIAAITVSAAAATAACPILIAAAGTHSLSTVATGSVFAALAGLGASAYTSARLDMFDRAADPESA